MTISSSLNAGVAGLAANATRLGTISDNIANSATKGYKRVETDFTAMVMAGNGSKYTAGGVRASTYRLVDERGALIGTSNATDLAVRGDGFLPVAQSTEVLAGNANPSMFLTSTGSFRLDADGYLRSESGLMLLGWKANANGTIPNNPRDTSAGLEPVQIAANQLLSSPTTSVSLGVNLPATETNGAGTGGALPLTVEYFDNLGKSETLNVSFTPTDWDGTAGTAPFTDYNQWVMTINDTASVTGTNTAGEIGEYLLTFDNGPTNGGTLATAAVQAPGGGAIAGAAYNAADGTIMVTTASGPIEITIGRPGDNNALTQRADRFEPLSVTKDGSPAGNMVSVEVDENGFVNAFFDTGMTTTIYQVPLVAVPNPNGMIALDKQTYQTSPDSGNFYLWDAGSGPTGEVVGFAREESTTDVAKELTDMIQTQRAYSSNAKVIQTVDEMLQETTNIKR